MKKILKNASLFIIAIALMFAFNGKAMAACEGETSETCRVGARGVIKAGGNNFRYRSITNNTSTNRSLYGTYDNERTQLTTVGINAHYEDRTDYTNWTFQGFNEAYSAMMCLDAQYEGKNPIYAERFLLNSGDNINIKAFDYALMYVLTDGGKGVLQQVNSANITNYFARLAAARMLTYVFGFYSTDGADTNRLFMATYNTANRFIKDDATAYNKLNKALQDARGGKLNTLDDRYKNYYFEARNGSSTLTVIKNYLNNAMNAAADYIVNNASGAKVTMVSALPVSDTVETTNTYGTLVSRDIVHTFTVSGLPKGGDNVFKLSGITFQEGTTYDGLTSYVKSVSINGTTILNTTNKDEFNNNLKDKNLLDTYDFKNETTIKVTVHFEGYKSLSATAPRTLVALKCGQSPIKYAITGEYSNNEFGDLNKYVATIWYSGESQMQRYVGIESAGSSTTNNIVQTFKSEYETYLIDACSCTELEEACSLEYDRTHNFNGTACQDLKKSNCGDCTWLDLVCEKAPTSPECDESLRSEVCDVTCDTSFETFECCNERGDLIVSTVDNKEVNIKGLENANDTKVCFVTRVDRQAQSYGTGTAANNALVEGVKDQKGNSFTLASMKDNSYCTVSCKEDYVMNMPTAKLVNAGRYFTFKATVNGTKTCYTNTIDRDKFNQDIIDRQEELVAAYNNYSDWLAASQASSHSVTGSYVSYSTPTSTGCYCSQTTSSYTSGWATSSYNYSYFNISSTNEATGTIRGSMTTRTSSKSVSSSLSSVTGPQNTNMDRACPTKDDPNKKCSCGGYCNYYSVSHTATQSELNSYISQNLSSARARLQSAQTAYANTIKEYNACSGNWSSSDIKYQPNVTYDYQETYLDDHGLLGVMDETRSAVSSSSWYCNSYVNSLGVETSKANIDNKYSICSTNSGNTRAMSTSISYLYCTESGCSTKSESISNARYKKTTSSITANYEPATLFYNRYPSGEIEINQNDSNVALEHKLPVALGTERGIYKYTVNIENLGELYATNDRSLGRYTGASTAVIDPNKIVYNCSYLVNMAITNEDRLVCDFDDLCTDDCISQCIGPHCNGGCDGDDCIAECVGVGCIYDKDAGTSLLERTVSLNNMFPNGTDAYNWTNQKGTVTRNEIESEDRDNGNEIYNTTPVLSITIDPSVSREIKRYNNDHEGDGGYSNDTLSCYALGGYSEIACYSSFITSLINGEFGNNVVNTNSAIQKSNGYRTVSDNNTRYFTPWSGLVSEEQMLGPAWK